MLTIAETEPTLPKARVEGLLARAGNQAERLRLMHLDAIAAVLGNRRAG